MIGETETTERLRVAISHKWRCAGIYVAAVLLCGCWGQSSPPSDGRRPDIALAESTPSGVTAIILRVREGGTSVLDDRERESLKSWLTKTIVKGETTKTDVVGIFGKRFLDLDRPLRDSIVSIQYAVGTYGNETQLQFDFDPDADVVTDWSLGHAICGFCPHVFVNDGRWRLEGKMLAGCIGPAQEDRDVLVLPRMQVRDGRLSVKLSNLAAELDYIDEVRLGIVELTEDEQLDVGVDGVAYLWRPVSGAAEAAPLATAADGQMRIPLNSAIGSAVVVLELRNTTAFETAMRRFVRAESDAAPKSAIQVDFDGERSAAIPPVGTKFYRRVVLPVPGGSNEVRLEFAPSLWIVRWAWVGTGRAARDNVAWLRPDDAEGPIGGIAAKLMSRDGERICLEPMQEVSLRFHSPEQSSGERRLGYVLRMSGYYDFVEAR